LLHYAQCNSYIESVSVWQWQWKVLHICVNSYQPTRH